MTLLKQWLDNEFAAAASWHHSIEGFIRALSSKAQEFHQMCFGSNEICDNSSGSNGSDSDSNDTLSNMEDSDDEEDLVAAI